jgi:hypothetical protein
MLMQKIQDMLRALGVDEKDRKHYYTISVRKDDIPEKTSTKARLDAMATLFIITPSLLFNLWQFLTKIKVERQVLHVDETYNVVSSAQLFYVWGTTISDIHHGKINGLITRQFRPFLYQLSLIQTNICASLALTNLQRIAASAFNQNFVPRFVVIDYSSMLWNELEHAMSWVELIRCVIHIFALFDRPDWCRKHFTDIANVNLVLDRMHLLKGCITGPQFAT